jgi:hypothetical protein
MKTLKRAFDNIFTRKAKSQPWNVYKEWSYQRSKALGPSDLAEIDAIFSRHLNSA